MTVDNSFELRLADVVSRHIGSPVTIENLKRLSGGAVAESWWLDAITTNGKYELILRLSRSEQGKDSPYPDKKTEAGIQKAVIMDGVPVPEIHFVLDDADELGSGYAMQRIPGETIPRKILRDDEYAKARKIMARQCGDILYRIHAVDTSRLPTLSVLTAQKQLDVQYQMYQSFNEPHPVFEYAFKWLKNNMPNDVTPCLVHADFRNGNLIIGGDGIRAIIDWEMAHLGDPMEDMGWLCVNSWRFGNIDKPVGGFGNRDELFAGYEAAGGSVDQDRVHFWEIFGTLKWGLICLVQAFTHLSGRVRSVELAAIGRRVSETEIDLLELLA